MVGTLPRLVFFEVFWEAWPFLDTSVTFLAQLFPGTCVLLLVWM